MAKSKYIGIQPNFANYSLVIEGSKNLEEINSDWGDESGGQYRRCQCPFCHLDITENQYKTGKIVEYKEEPTGDLALSLAHKTCLDKLKG